MRAQAAVLAAALVLAGCDGWQSALDARGPQAEDIRDLFALFLAVCALVWLLVMAALAWSVLRRRAWMQPAPLAIDAGRERRSERIVTFLAVATAAAVVVLSSLSFLTGRGLAAMQGRPDALTITLKGHQWWWEIRYDDPQPSRVLTTANEIHVPVGRPVRLLLSSDDVIHSFWVPNLHGKRDLIPGRPSEIWLRADREGIYRGQCAEFCGMQHAHMALLVIAESGAAFEGWREAQLQPAAEPADDETRRGKAVMEGAACLMCHAVRGTAASGQVAPDLTHLASRRSIAAETLPLTRGALGAWIADPQAVKPGNHMPLVPLPPAEFQALLAYLMVLK